MTKVYRQSLLDILTEDTQHRCALTDGENTLNYTDLIRRVSETANWLQELGVVSVGLHARNSLEWVIVDLACQQAEIICTPLPDFFSQPQLLACIEQAHIDLLLTDADNCLTHTDLLAIEPLKHDSKLKLAALRVPQVHQHDLGGIYGRGFPTTTQKVTFTSGSTGSPKGVCLSIENQWRTARALAETINIQYPKHLCLLPLSTLLENVAGVYAPLLCGGEIVIPNDVTRGLSGSSGVKLDVLLSCISQTAPTTMILIPQLLSALVAACEQGWIAPSSLKFIAVGGGKVSASLLHKAVELGLPVYEGYGLSECGSVVALNVPGANRPGMAGRILPHCNVTCIGGEIIVSGSVFLGYLTDRESWYPRSVYTGDLGNMEGNYLHIAGRSKNMLISSFGRNISPEWVESELMAHPALTQVIIVGDQLPYLSALLCARPGISDHQIEAIVEATNQNLPDYAQIKRFLHVDPERLGTHMTANGRPIRQSINDAFAAEIDRLYAPNNFLKETQTMANTTPSFYQVLQQRTADARQYLLGAPIIDRCMRGDINLDDYIAFLTQAFHHVKHTTPLLMATGARMTDDQEWLREALAEYIDEELGHQEWILNDIEHCGADKEVARRSTPNASTELMVAYAYDTVQRGNPVGFFGMVLVLEGTSINMATPAADSIQKALDLPNNAFSYLRSHGALDQDHIKFYESLMNRITDSRDQETIIHCANMFYRLYGNVFRELEQPQPQRIAA